MAVGEVLVAPSLRRASIRMSRSCFAPLLDRPRFEYFVLHTRSKTQLGQPGRRSTQHDMRWLTCPQQAT